MAAAELRVTISKTGSRVVLELDGKVVESEAWKPDVNHTKQEIADIARCLFTDAYQVLQYATHVS